MKPAPSFFDRIDLNAGNLDSRLVDIESQIKHYRLTNQVTSPIVRFKYGPTPLLISAPHETPQTRRHQYKAAEPMTGPLAIILAQALSATVMIPVVIQKDDPNYDSFNQSDYKQQLADIIADYKLLVDLHGMSDHWGGDICVGVADGQVSKTASRVIACLKKHLKTTINQPFSSAYPNTIAAFGRRRGCQSLQLELAAHLRQPETVVETYSILKASLGAGLYGPQKRHSINSLKP